MSVGPLHVCSISPWWALKKHAMETTGKMGHLDNMPKCLYVEEILSQTLMCFTRTEYFSIMFHSSYIFYFLQIKVGQMFL